MDDYLDAADRHFEDAKLLISQAPPRLANASHLFGIATECAVKTVLQGRRPPQANATTMKGHIFTVISQKLATNSVLKGNQELLSKMQSALGAFAQWDIAQRYRRQSDTQFSVARVTEEQNGATEMIRLRNLWLKGRI